MKRLWKIALSALLIIVFAVSVTACGISYDRAEDNLEDEDYEIEISKDENFEGIPIEKSIRAYNYDTDDYIQISVFEKSSSAKLAYNMIKSMYDTELKELENDKKLLEHLLKEYEDDLSSSEIDDIEDEIKDIKDEIEEMKEEFEFGRSGKTVWYGTVDAVKDAK